MVGAMPDTWFDRTHAALSTNVAACVNAAGGIAHAHDIGHSAISNPEVKCESSEGEW
jgi:hypothetical protein